MYEIVYTRTAAKDIPKLKAAHLDDKAKQLISILKQNPYQSPPSYEKGTVPLNVGDAVFLKTICCGWLHGTVVCFLDTGFGLSGPGIAGIRRINYQDIVEARKTAPPGELYNQPRHIKWRHNFGR